MLYIFFILISNIQYILFFLIAMCSFMVSSTLLFELFTRNSNNSVFMSHQLNIIFVFSCFRSFELYFIFLTVTILMLFPHPHLSLPPNPTTICCEAFTGWSWQGPEPYEKQADWRAVGTPAERDCYPTVGRGQRSRSSGAETETRSQDKANYHALLLGSCWDSSLTFTSRSHRADFWTSNI